MVLVGNIQRHDLDAIEVALSYRRLIQKIKPTQEELNRRIGKKRSTIASQLRLPELSPIIQRGIRDGIISMRHGFTLINIENEDDQLNLYEKIIQKALSVRETEELAKYYKKTKDVEKKTHRTNLTNSFKNAAKVLSEHFKSPIDIQRAQSGKGKIIIPFDSDEDFEYIKKLLS
ncbi:MAG: ParB/RepB/Spo0J family partition protein [Flavobacteriales bacterium AspAUS03]